jgi:RND family efflux transporter, MFP subunit
MNTNVFAPLRLYVLLLPAFAACGNNGQDGSQTLTDTIPVTVIPLVSHDTAATIHATGTFTTDDETALSFKNGGVVRDIRVKEGDRFTRGQVLATLEATEIEAMAEQSRLAVEKAERDYQRAQRLFRDSVATLEQMENAKTAYDAARADAERAAYNVGHAVIRAVKDGYVLQRPVNPGQVVGPGTPVLMVSGAGRDGWLLKVGVSDRQWAAIQVGDSASVMSDAVGDRLIKAEVHRKVEGMDSQSGTFTIYLKMAEPISGLASGMFGQAYIHLSAETDAWFIPYEAILDGDAGEAYVFVTDDGKTAKRLRVRIAEIRNDHAVVTEGLEGARSLIVSGSPYLRDGSKITVK